MNRIIPIDIDKIVVLITLLLFAGAGAANAAKVALVWDKPDGDVAGYRIYYGLEGSEADAGPGRTVAPDQTRCEISGLVQGQRYWFRLTHFNRNGVESALSEKLFLDVPILEVNNDGIRDAAIAIGADDGNPPAADVPAPDNPAEDPDPNPVPETPDPPADRAPAANPDGSDGGEKSREESGGGGGGGTCFIGSLAR